MAALAVPAMIMEPQGLPRMRGLQRELDQVNGENRELERNIGDLRSEVQRLRDDPTAVEAIARDQLGMVRTSEVVFQFPPSKGAESM